MNSSRYVETIGSVAAVPDVIDDLVGVRVVCTNKSDVRRLQAQLNSRLEKSSLEPRVASIWRCLRNGVGA
ncbi:hypothetical protein G5V59_12880 [Nocardioides sp. W3-2-3]|nr:hypothetical protein [Nocardioides convexus]